MELAVMPTELTWKSPFATTCLHLADGLARGTPLVDARLEPAMASASRLRVAVEWCGAPPGRLWRLLTGLSGQNQSPAQIAEIALVKTVGRADRLSGTAAALAGAIADLQAAVRTAVPSLEASPMVEGMPTMRPTSPSPSRWNSILVNHPRPSSVAPDPTARGRASQFILWTGSTWSSEKRK